MKAKLKAVFLTAALVAAALLALGAMNLWVVQPPFKTLEQTQALEDSNRARAAISNELQQLGRTLSDWANWDNAYAFAENRDAHFLKTNLNEWPTIEKTVHLNFCLILDRQSQILYVGGYDSDLGGAVIPARFQGEAPPILALLQPLLDSGQTLSGLLSTEQGLLLFAAQPILTSAGTGPVNGVFAFGRFLDAPLLRELTQNAQVQFELFQENDQRLSPEEQALFSNLPPATPQSIPGQHRFIYETLADLDGRNIALIRTPVRHEISQIAQSTGRTLSGVLGVVTLLLTLGGIYRLNRMKREELLASDTVAWSVATLVMLVGMALTTSIFLELRRSSREALERQFRFVATEQAQKIIEKFRNNLRDLDSVRRLYEGSLSVRRLEFRQFVTPILNEGGFLALEWLPRVTREQRAAFEATAQQEAWPGFEFKECDGPDRKARAADRPEYFPVYYLEPYAGNAAALGCAPGPTHPMRGAVLNQARDSGQIALSERHTVVQETAGQYSVLAFAPVYQRRSTPDTVEERRETLQGFVLGVMRISDVIDQALADTESQGLILRLLDQSAADEHKLLHVRLPRLGSRSPTNDPILKHHIDFSLANRIWRIESQPNATFIANHRNVLYRWAPIIGLLLTAMTALYLFTIASQRQRAEALVAARTFELRMSEKRLRLAGAVFESARESIIVTEASGRIIAVNPAFTVLSGYAEIEVLGRNPRFLQSSHHADAYFTALWKTVAEQGAWQGEFRGRNKSGALFTALATISEVRDATQITHYVVIATDITHLREVEQRIEHLAYYDALTDLPNRTLLAQRAALALALAAQHNAPLALLLLDLDRFKEINDALGHAEGDALLVQVAVRIESIMRDTDTACRVGGDEFVLLLPDANQSAALERANRLMSAFHEPFSVAGHSLRTTASIGIAIYPHDGATFDDLLKNADAALYQAKQEGRNHAVFYAREMNIATFERLMLESELRRAIESGQLRAYFQPKVRLTDGAPLGAEALVRWLHPEQGLIPPGRFISVAEASDLIVALGDWMLEEVCQQLARWHVDGLPDLSIAVNLAARHFRAPGLIERIEHLLTLHQLKPQALELELTESTLLETGAQTMETLQALQQLGVRLAIDDFGTGYSSLGYLKRLPINALKVDQSFVRDLVIDADDRTLAATIVTLGHSLGLEVVAEGVETEAQRRFLLEQGCDFAQGYLFSPPLPAEAFVDWLRGAPPVPTGDVRSERRRAH